MPGKRFPDNRRVKKKHENKANRGSTGELTGGSDERREMSEGFSRVNHSNGITDGNSNDAEDADAASVSVFKRREKNNR